ncbi:MAG: hypothetical protein HY721_23910, partial [Planctomycetes bacterium]|nr:hypothetical protein [Planctomycetota bacterium]
MRRIRPVACLVLPIAVLPARGPRGEDTALVPLEGDAREVQEAAEHIAAGRFREGVAMLQGLVAPEASRKAEAYLVEVPATLPREAGALGDALRAASAKGSPARPLALPAPRARGGLGLPMARLPPPSPGPAAGRRFLPVEEVAAHLHSSLRGEALEAYRELYDGLGASLLAEHRERDDPARLERAARNLFWTSSGDDAAEILGDSCFERGAYAEAARWWRRILSEHPAPDVPIGRVRAKLLVALRALGAEKEETLERDRLLAASPGDAGLVREIEAAVPRTTPGGRPPPEEPSRWGGEVRDALPPALPGAAGGGPHLASAPLQLSWASWAWSGQGLERSLEPGLGRPGRFHGRGVPPDAPGHFPFVALADGDDVYLSGVFSLYRFDGRPGGGKLLREYRKPVSSIDVLAYQERAENDSGLYTVTLWKKALEPSPSLAALPGEVLVTHYVSDRVSAKKYLGYYIYREIPIRSLVAFDAATGRALWKTGSAARPPRAAGEAGGRAGRGALEPADEWEGLDDEDLPFPGFPRGFRPRSPLELDDPESAISRDFSYTSPAIVRGGLVVAGGWFQRGYVNTALRALDLRTGELVWETLLSGAQVEPTMFGEMAREPLAGAIHEADGTVYYV